MRKILFEKRKVSRFFSSLLVPCFLFALGGCKETIDEGNFAIKTEQTVTDYLAGTPDRFSDIKSIFDRVRLGRSSEASSLTSVLSARGNYTVFAPNNAAVRNHIKSLGVNTPDELSYEQAELIAKSCIIDNGELSAYEEAVFPSDRKSVV